MTEELKLMCLLLIIMYACNIKLAVDSAILVPNQITSRSLKGKKGKSGEI